MFSKIASASLIGFSCLSLVAAAPFSFANNPLGNGFPNPSPAQIAVIEAQAHGSLPNGAPPAIPPKDDSFTSLRLIAFNELFEVAFFTELLANITHGYDGYNIDHDGRKQYVIESLTNILAQEELHALNANGALAHFNEGPIQPCQYNFPVNTVEDAIALASTFTDVVLGTLQDVVSAFGTDGDAGLIRGVASVIGQEGEQNGFYRRLLNKLPSALPFLTTSTREFAFSALNQNFVVPGSCPNLNSIALPIFPALTVETADIDAKAQDLTFSITIPSTGTKPEWKSDYSGLSIFYINQQNTPVVETIKNVKVTGSKVTFQAAFPFDAATFGNGLTIAALATTPTALTADGIAKASTVFGPGLIEIN